MKKYLRENWAMGLILAVAAFLRFFKLSTLPPGLHPDEAANGLDIISMLEKGNFQAIYDTNGPREALFFYLQAIPVWIGSTFKIAALNFTPLALRIAPAVIGVATVWAVYLLGKEIKNKNVGLFAAAALAVSAWHIQFSRNGFRAIMTPLLLSLTFYFFLRAYKEKKIQDFVGFGASLSLGFYTYLSFRMVPLALIALLVYILVTNKEYINQNLKKLLIAGGVFLILMVPMFMHFVKVPADIAGRSSTSIFNPELNNGSPILTLGDNVLKTILMFNYKGDENFRHNLGGSPMLDPVLGLLFWIGVATILIKLKDVENYMLFMWFGALSIPQLVTAEGIPHALRMVGVIPVVFVSIGLAVDLILEKLNREKLAYGVVGAILLISGFFSFKKYFVDFPAYGATGEAYAEDMVGIAEDINTYGAGRQNVLIVGEYGTKTVEFITHSTKNPYQRYEVRDFENQLNLSDRYKIYVQKDWYDEAQRKLPNLDSIELKPVYSQIDGRVIYYEFENI